MDANRGPSGDPAPDRSGFTLIEMLVVIAIISILITLVSSAVVSARKSAYNTACLSTLRQTGTAFTLFATEHKGYLPPNLHPYQSPYFNLDRRYLVHPAKLGPYLGAPVPEPGLWTTNLEDMEYAKNFECPARALHSGDMRQMYRMNTRVEDVGGSGVNPWGTGNAARDFLNDPEGGHVRSLTLGAIGDPTTTWLMADTDQQFPVGSTPSNAPEQPVHGNHRNAIYFDMHVGRLHIPDVTSP